MYIYILGLGTIADIFTITVEPLATAMLLASRDYCDICTCFCTCACAHYLCKHDENHKTSVDEVWKKQIAGRSTKNSTHYL